MKILLDANLSWRLAKLLSSYFDKVEHVDHNELSVPSKDIDIWNYALKYGFTIATNDEDFLNLLLSKGYPPKIILFKTGNQSTKSIADYLIANQKSIEELLQKDNVGVLEILSN